MRFLYSSLLFFIVCNASFCQTGFHFEKDKKKVVIPFKLINNLIFIPLTLNGEKLTFLLDTGVEETVLFSLDEQEEVSLYQLEKIKLRGLGADDDVEAFKSSRNRLETAGFVDVDHEIYLILDQDFNFSSQVGIPVNGIIGYHFFKNHLVEIDYSRKKVIVHAGNNPKIRKRLDAKYQQESITLENNKPYYFTNVSSTNNTRPSKMLIDTGNSDAIWLFLNRAKDLELPAKNIYCFLGRGFSGNIFGQRARINHFTFGNQTFTQPIGTFPDSIFVQHVTFVDQRVGSLGGEVLSRFNVFFDYQEHKLYTKPNNKVKQPFTFDRSGIEVQHDGLEWVTQSYQDNSTAAMVKANQGSGFGQLQNNFKIRFELKPVFRIFNIREDSPAQLAGLQKGDRIVKLNSQLAQNLTIEKINELLKSEEGNTIEIEVERKGIKLKYKFQLKNIL